MLKYLPKMLVGALLALTFNACAQEHSDHAAAAPWLRSRQELPS
ncbi:hypothetical protein [Dokdonella sp.]